MKREKRDFIFPSDPSQAGAACSLCPATSSPARATAKLDYVAMVGYYHSGLRMGLQYYRGRLPRLVMVAPKIQTSRIHTDRFLRAGPPAAKVRAGDAYMHAYECVEKERRSRKEKSKKGVRVSKSKQEPTKTKEKRGTPQRSREKEDIYISIYNIEREGGERF